MSVHLSYSGVVPKRTKLATRIFHIRRAADSSFCIYQAHPEIRNGSTLARALNESGVDTNCRFSTFKPPCKIRPRLLLITNRKSHMHFPLVPKSTTLVDSDWPWTAIMQYVWRSRDIFHQDTRSPLSVLSIRARYAHAVRMVIGSVQCENRLFTGTSEVIVFCINYMP